MTKPFWKLLVSNSCLSASSESEMTAGKGDDRKRRMKPKRRKTLERAPRLTVLSYEADDEEVECRLDLSNRNTVTFKFALENDKPTEIAESLVSFLASDLCLHFLYKTSHIWGKPYI